MATGIRSVMIAVLSTLLIFVRVAGFTAEERAGKIRNIGQVIHEAILSSASGNEIDKVILTGIRTDLNDERFLRIELRDAFVSSFGEVASSRELPVEKYHRILEKSKLNTDQQILTEAWLLHFKMDGMCGRTEPSPNPF